MQPKKFFVYGTLKQGFHNNRLLQDSKFVGKSKTTDRFYLQDIGFPGAVKSEEGRCVAGELFEVEKEEVITSLDWLEGNGNFYTREVVIVEDESGEETSAWMYILPSVFVNSNPCPVDEEGNFYWHK